MHEACGEFSQWNVFLPPAGGQLLPSNVMLKYACSQWHCHSWINPACSHHGPHLLSERKKILPIFTVCMPNLNCNPLFWGLWYAHSHTLKKKKNIFNKSYSGTNLWFPKYANSLLTSIKSKLFYWPTFKSIGGLLYIDLKTSWIWLLWLLLSFTPI